VTKWLCYGLPHKLCICFGFGLKMFLCEFQALQLGQDANTRFGFFNGQRCQMCLRSDPLLKVMERLSNPGESVGTCRLLLRGEE